MHSDVSCPWPVSISIYIFLLVTQRCILMLSAKLIQCNQCSTKVNIENVLKELMTYEWFLYFSVMESMEYDRGRVYQCTKCSYTGEKRSAIRHYTNQHFTMHDHKYFCSLCGFSSNLWQKMKRHSSFYLPHSTAKSNALMYNNYLGSDEQYYISNSEPTVVDPNIHLIRWEQEASNQYWVSRRRTKPVTAAAGSLEQLAAKLPALQTALSTVLNT